MAAKSLARMLLASLLGSVVHALSTSLVKRVELSEFAATATVQWSDAAGNHLRNYHIRDDCTVIENSWEPGFTAWAANALPFCAASGGPLIAVLITAADGGPEQIQLFFRGNNEPYARSAVWQAGRHWDHDRAFNSLNIKSELGTAVTYRTPPGHVKNIRLFAFQNEIDEYGDFYNDYSFIYEYVWTSNGGWRAPTGGKHFLRSSILLQHGYLTALATSGGTYVRLFYWDGDTSFRVDRETLLVNEARWDPNRGWTVLGAPYSGLRDFYVGGPLAAVSWDDGARVRIYMKFNTYAGTRLFREYASDHGVWSPPSTLPGWSLEKTSLARMSAVAWTYPSALDVHIRIYTAKCAEDNCTPHINEFGYDTGIGWADLKNLPA